MEQKHLQHLYLRAGFGIGYNKLQELQSKSKTTIVSKLFLDAEKYEELQLDLSEFKELLQPKKLMKLKMMDGEFRALNKKSRQKVKELNYAWIDRMVNSSSILNEKMTLFWANVFVCRDNTIWHIQRYNNTLRTNALGNFKDFVKAIAKEPSMSKYLNNRQNVKQSPNENFARELMELFTLGVGHYTEQDIKESARAFTGWSFKRNGDFFLRAKKHDYGEKTFLGKTGNFNGDDIIDIILEQKQCAKFICGKIYRYFVNPKINDAHVEELTQLFYKDYNIKKLMHHIFSSDWFYDDENIGVKIKSPIELLVSIQNIVPVQFKKKKQLLYLQKMMGQVLLNPPNVSGWKGDKSWIDSNTLMFRMKLPSILLNDAVINLDEKGTFEASFEAYYSKEKNKRRFLKVTKSWDVFNNEYGSLSAETLKKILIVGNIDKDTEALLNNLKIENNKDFCVQIMSIPEYQLC